MDGVVDRVSGGWRDALGDGLMEGWLEGWVKGWME